MAPRPEVIPNPSSEGNANQLLQEALRLPAQNRVVAEWVFDEQEQDFHVNSNTVRPSAFDNALVMVSKSKFIPGNDTPLPSSSYQQITNGNANDFTTLFMLHILVKESDGFYMGYSFTIGSPFEESLLPLRDAFGTYSIIGRFVLDNDRRHMLVYISNFTPRTNLIMALNWHENNHRSRSYFSIPNEEYSFHKLPTEVIGFTINDEFLEPGQSAAPTHIPKPAEKEPPSPASDKEIRSHEESTVTKTSAYRSLLPTESPWVEDVTELHPNLLDTFESPDTADSFSAPGRVFEFGWPPENSSALSYPRDLHQKEKTPTLVNGINTAVRTTDVSIPDFVSGIWGVFQGTFFSPAVIRQLRTGVGECNTPSIVGQIRVQIEAAPPEDMKVLQTFARRRYYAETLPVAPDEYFLTSDRDENANGHTNGIE